MKLIQLFFFILIIFLSGYILNPDSAFAQDKKKGDLEDFSDDYGDEESEDSGNSDGSTEFFLWLFFDNISEFTRLWGKTPGTEFGPFPSHPYASGSGFSANSEDYRSYFFNTEFNYHYLNENLQSFIVKWESQFVRNSKLSFDLAVYEETVYSDNFYSLGKDYLTFWGVRYGYAVVRNPQLILNVEGGVRGFTRNAVHSGPEIALDVQLFPKKPLIFETEIAAAYVSSGALYTFESSVGVALGRFELLGGLRILKNRSADMLHGFRVGMRIWY